MQRWLGSALAVCVAVLALSSVSIQLGLCVNAEEAIALADSGVLRAFSAVSDAEKAGAKVSDLLIRLNRAEDTLSSAKEAFQTENLALALTKADECISSAGSIENDAGVLKGEAEDVAGRWWQTVAFSTIGAGAFAAALCGIWVYVKRRYTQRVLGLKPEVEA